MSHEEIVNTIWGDIVLRGIPRITQADVSEWVTMVEKNLREPAPQEKPTLL